MAKVSDIREAVEDELTDDGLVDAASITVRNLNGDVALNGTVPSYPQYLEAAAAARRVDGVTHVHNHLKVVLPPENYRDDALLTTAANNALAASDTAPAGVEATAKNGHADGHAEVPQRVRRRRVSHQRAGWCPQHQRRDRADLRRRTRRHQPTGATGFAQPPGVS